MTLAIAPIIIPFRMSLRSTKIPAIGPKIKDGIPKHNARNPISEGDAFQAYTGTEKVKNMSNQMERPDRSCTASIRDGLVKRISFPDKKLIIKHVGVKPLLHCEDMEIAQPIDKTTTIEI